MRTAILLALSMLASSQTMAASIGIYSTPTCGETHSVVDAGKIIVLPGLQTGCALLHTLTLHATSNVSNATLQITSHVTPSGPFGNPPGNCPWLLFYECGSCDGPATCVEGGTHILNPTVAVTPSTWSNVKSMYNE